MKQRCINMSVGVLLLAALVASTLTGSDDTGTLGPADAIVLSGKDGDLTISNVDNHIKWGDEKTSTVWSLGFMETGKALSQLMKQDHFIEEREDLDERLDERISDVRASLDAIIEEGKTLKPDDPETPALRQRAEKIYAEFQRIQKLGVEARASMVARHMQTSYNEVVDSVNVVAQRMNIDMVLRFIPPDGDFEEGNPESTIMQIRLRTALRLPEGVDITDEVLSELGLEQQ